MYFVFQVNTGEFEEYASLSQAESYLEEQVNVYNEDINDFTVVDGKQMDIESQIKVVLS